MYYLCEKYYKPITVQYYIANCVSWVPSLTLLDLQTNWTYERTLGMKLARMWGLNCIQWANFKFQYRSWYFRMVVPLTFKEKQKGSFENSALLGCALGS